MKFWSNYVNWRFTAEPTRYEYHGHYREKIEGIHAQFTANQFDTEAQGWDDATRTMVEQALLHSHEYGQSLRAVSDDDFADMVAKSQPNLPTCLFTRTIEGDVLSCSEPAISEDGYCSKHASAVEHPQTKPNRRKEPVA